ncbi:unnamed protein product [Cyclocybe aegerita]|uniref:Uncharacterized protein n=1 Tax=Cyclocybe aegerita TaxID=1973307 RepID=A0A8S0XTN5_CYCAE|nr:unnamed protein product [Cyclocybe aegerita]
MVQITSVVLAALLIAPSLAVPVINGQQLEAREDALAVREPSSEYDIGLELSERDLEDILERDPNFFKKAFKKIKKIATPANIGKVASFVVRDLEDVEFSERDLQELEELIERDPSFFKKAFKKIKKIAKPSLLGKAAGIAGNFIREDALTTLSERDIADLEELEELAARDPNFFKKAFKKIKKIATPGNIGKVASFVVREDELDMLAELAARDPSFFKKAFKKIKKIAKPSLLGKAAGLAGNFIREVDDFSEFSERELEGLQTLAELAARDPSFFKKAFKKIKKIAKPSLLGKAAGIAGNFIREDAGEVEDLLDREYEEFDELD